MLDPDAAAEFARSVTAALDRDDPVKARGALIEAGWLDALGADAPTAVAVVFRAQGRTGRDAAALDDVMGAVLGVDDLTVAHPVAPGLHAVRPAHRDARRLLWLAGSGGRAVVVQPDGPLDATPIGGVDPAAGLLGLAGRPAGATTELPAELTVTAIAAGRRALAHQMVAESAGLLDLATTHARSRTQFGVPVGSFQAVQHRLAETLVAVSAADAAAVAAATRGTPVTATVAKILAGRAADAAARHCFQVFGGIAFTVEHPFHHGYRRLLVLDRLVGDRRTLERELGAAARRGELAGERLVELDDVPRVPLDDRVVAR